MQLHSTPWLGATFHTKDPVFHTEKAAATASLLDYAFVSSRFAPSSMTQKPSFVTSIGRRMSRNALVFALGVMLLELSYGKPLSAFVLPDELDTDAKEMPETGLLVAQRLVQDTGDRESNDYSWATASCIQCDVGQPRQSSLNEDDFRAGFISHVIEPLKDDYVTLSS